MRKWHTYRLDAFNAGDAGPLAAIEEGRVRVFRVVPDGSAAAIGLQAIAREPPEWPRVEIVLNHAGAGAALVDALVLQGLAGLVVAGTGNGTLSSALEVALQRAAQSGVRVLRASRCAQGPVLGDNESDLLGAGALSAVQARVELLVQLLTTRTVRKVSHSPTR